MKMPLTILIVDDEEIVHKLLRVSLMELGDVIFLEAKDAMEALKVAREHCGPIDVLVSDVGMPGRINGTEMAALLSHARPEMKIVLISGYAPESLRMKPDWHFVPKPFGAREIRERIGSILTDHWVAA